MRSPKALLAIAAGLSLVVAAASCGGDGGSKGGGLEEGGSGGGPGGTGGGTACRLTDLGSQDCMACVGQSVFACPQVAFACFMGSGDLFTCARDSGCFAPGSQSPFDVACLLGNCATEFADANFCLGACPQYVDCFR